MIVTNHLQPVSQTFTDGVAFVAHPTVYIIDNDREARLRVASIAQSLGMRYEEFQRAEDFLDANPERRPGCLVMDIVLDGMSGLCLQDHLRHHRQSIPIVVVTEHADVTTTVSLLSNDAVTLIEKPLHDGQLISAIEEAVQFDRQQMAVTQRLRKLQACAATLSDREYEVLLHIMNGRLNKSIARELSVTQRTVENIRARIMDKFNATTAVQLARKFAELQLLDDIARCLTPSSLRRVESQRSDIEQSLLSR